MQGKLHNSFGALDENSDSKYVIVTNLNDSIDDYDLREKFEKFGHVPSIQLPFETEAKYGKCARLEFALAPAARAACSKLGGKPWRGQRIQAYTYDRWKRMLASKNSATATRFTNVQVKNKVFVGGLGMHINVHMMRRYFQQFGPIDARQSKVIMDRGGKSKGYGFVVFKDPHHAQMVLSQTLHWIEGKSINVGPVHEKRLVPVNPVNQTAQQPVGGKKSSRSRSRSYSSSRSGSSSSTSSSRSRSKSVEEEPKEVVVPILGEPEEAPEEPEQDEEEYQKEVEKQAAKIEEAEKKAKTLQQRRAERRARWKRKAAISPTT